MGIQWPQDRMTASQHPGPMFGLNQGMGAPQQPYTPIMPGYGSIPWRQPPMLVSQFTSPQGYPISLYTLSNGHRVLIEQRPTDIISLRTFVNTGSIHENPMKKSGLYGATGFPPGIAHLDEHCHFLCTQNFPRKNSWVETVSRYGARLNASTSSEMVQHELAFNREDLSAMLSLHAESVLRPIYNDAEIEQEKQNVVNEMGERTNHPEYKVMSKLSELLFDRPEEQTLGKPEDVRGTTAAQLQRFHNTFYTPTNMMTVISGRVDPNMVLASLNKEFGNNPPVIRADNTSAIRMALRPGEIRHATVHDAQLNYSMVNLGFPAPNRMNLRERMAMEFIVDLLGGGPTSLLEKQVKDQQRLATSVSVGYDPRKATGALEVQLHTNPGQEQQALAATLQGISTLSRYTVTPEKLDETRNRILHGFKQGFNNVELATQILGEESLNQSLPYYLNYMQLAQSITAEDISNTARKYLDPKTYAVVFGVPGKGGAT
jgi:zinc protease